MIRMDNPLFLGAPREVAALTTQPSMPMQSKLDPIKNH
jgi:hypothetical protein